MLSLREQRPEPAPRLTRTEAILLSAAIHALVLFLLLYLPGRLPEPLMALLRGRPPTPRSAEPAALTATTAEREAQKAPIPLKFAYVRIPEEQPVESNPTAPLLSDRNRRAAQEVPTPPDAEQFSIDPHSEGDNPLRVVPDPTRPEGRENPLPDVREEGASNVEEETGPESPAQDTGVTRPGPEGIDGESPGAGGGADPGIRESDADGRPVARGGGQGGIGGPENGSFEEGPAVDPQQKLGAAMSDILSQEYKFTFHNPAYLRQGNYGTLSFDTQDFPWGEYGSILYARVLSNWLDRIPLAAREGMRGFACLRFVIERDGSISDITEVQPSPIPPFNLAASGAIKATNDLPPLPEHFPGDREGVTGCFFYNLHPSEVRAR